MANALYDKAREIALTTGLGWTTNTVRAVLVDTGAYTYSAAHDYYDDVRPRLDHRRPDHADDEDRHRGSGRRGQRHVPAVTGGVVRGGDHLHRLWRRRHVAADRLHRLGHRPPITPNGGDIIAAWDNGTNKIFRV